MPKLYDPLLDGKKSAYSISMPFELIKVVHGYARKREMNYSEATCKLIRLGYTYTQVLQAQVDEKKKLEEELLAKARKVADRPSQKRVKPKTPSKTRKKKKKKL